MYLISVGRYIFNLEYMIMAEDCPIRQEAAEHGNLLRLIMESGRVVELNGDDADLVRLHIAGLVAPTPGGEDQPVHGTPSPKEPPGKGSGSGGGVSSGSGPGPGHRRKRGHLRSDKTR